MAAIVDTANAEICRSYGDKFIQSALELGGVAFRTAVSAFEGMSALLFRAEHSALHTGLLGVTTVLLIAYVVEKRLVRKFVGFRLNNSLRQRVRAEKHKYYSQSQWLEDFGLWICIPSMRLFLFFSGALVLAYLLSNSCVFPSWLTWEADEPIVQGLFALLSGIGAVLFALIIFIAEIGRSERGRYAIRVLLRRTRLLAVATLCLFSFALLLGPNVNVVAALVIVTLLLMTIWAVFEVLRLTMSQSEMQRCIDGLFKDELIRNIEAAITRRFAQNILQVFLKENGKSVAFLPWLMDRENFDHISLPYAGTVKDINLGLLKQALKLVDRKLIIQTASGGMEEPVSQEPVDDETSDRPVAYIQKSIGDRIESDNRVVLSVKKGEVRGRVFTEVEGLIRAAYVMDRSEPVTSEELRNEFAELRQKFVTALKDAPASSVDQYVRTYSNLAEEFLNVLLRYPGRYDLKSARAEISNQFFGASWEEVGWLKDDVNEILVFALQNAEDLHTDALLSVLHLPVAICFRAIEKADNYLFQTFLPMLVMHCHYGHLIGDPELRRLVLDRCLQYPKEMSEYYLVPRLKKRALAKDDRSRLGDCLVVLQSIYYALARESYLSGNNNLVHELILEINNCTDDFEVERDRWNTKNLRWRLDNVSSADEKNKILAELDEQAFLEELAEKLNESKVAILLGISSALLKAIYTAGAADWHRELRTALSLLPTEFVDLVEALRKGCSIDSGFDRWERIAEPIEGAYWGDADRALSETVCIRLLMIQDLKTLKIDPARVTAEIGYRCDTDGILVRALKSVGEKSHELVPSIISEEEFARVSALGDLLAKVAKIQKENEANTKRNSALSVNRINDFRSTAVKEFREHITTRQILNHHLKCCVDHIGKYETANVITIGLNKIDDKAIFIEPWHVSYGGWGRAYGEAVADCEDAFLIHKIKEYAVPDKRGSLQSILSSTSGKFLVLVNVNGYLLFRDPTWKLTPEYQVKDKISVPGFAGILKVGQRTIRVYSVSARGEDPGILVIPESQKVVIEHFSPFSCEERISEQYQQQELGIEIRDLNADEARREEFIEKAPRWLVEEGKTHEERTSYLRGRVQVMVLERMRVTVAKSEDAATSIYWIPTRNEED